MKELPIEDMFAQGAKLRPTAGRSTTCIWLGSRPRRSRKGPWDYYEIVRTIPGDQAYLTACEGELPAGQEAGPLPGPPAQRRTSRKDRWSCWGCPPRSCSASFCWG